jgi:hypothetical protein
MLQEHDPHSAVDRTDDAASCGSSCCCCVTQLPLRVGFIHKMPSIKKIILNSKPNVQCGNKPEESGQFWLPMAGLKTMCILTRCRRSHTVVVQQQVEQPSTGRDLARKGYG